MAYLRAGRQTRPPEYLCRAIVCLLVLAAVLYVPYLNVFGPVNHCQPGKDVQYVVSGKTRPHSSHSQCPNGLIYVYDLPSRFNRDLLVSPGCKELDWGLCDYIKAAPPGFGFPVEKSVFTKSREPGRHLSQVPESVYGALYGTEQAIVAIMMYDFMVNHNPCRTNKSQEATAFFVPWLPREKCRMYYVHGEEVRNCTMRDFKAVVESLEAELPGAYRRNGGMDHIVVFSVPMLEYERTYNKDYNFILIYEPGRDDLYANNPEFSNITILTVEQYFQPNQHGIVWPSYFHPRSRAELEAWQKFVRAQKRTMKVAFAGKSRATRVIRKEVYERCVSSQDVCTTTERFCTGQWNLNANCVMELFLGSDFCLQPTGDTLTRRSHMDAIMCGCIPVLFEVVQYAPQFQYKWHLPTDSNRHASIIFDRDRVLYGAEDFLSELRSIPQAEVEAMREHVIQQISRVAYADWRDGTVDWEDAFMATTNGVLEHISRKLQS